MTARGHPDGKQKWPHLPLPYLFELSEGHKLDDVTSDWLTAGGPQHPVVPVQLIHGREVRAAHAHDDEGHGQVGGLHDGLLRVAHIAQHTIRQKQQNEVRLEDHKGSNEGLF